VAGTRSHRKCASLRSKPREESIRAALKELGEGLEAWMRSKPIR
jgi:hypothetical protein